MRFYAHVSIEKTGEEGARQAQELMEDLNNLGIIKITEEKKQEYFQKDKKREYGADHNYIVLHNLKERNDFVALMRSPKYEYGFEGLKWDISLTPQNREFSGWLREKAKPGTGNA